METQLSRQCNDQLHGRSLPRLLRGIASFFESREFGRGLTALSMEHSPTQSGYRAAANTSMGPPEPESMRSRLDPVPRRSVCGPPAYERPTPTQAELEALRWTMDGMTNREISLKLGLSEHEVGLRLQRVMRKFGCGTKYEAGLKAIKLRLIEGP